MILPNVQNHHYFIFLSIACFLTTGIDSFQGLNRINAVSFERRWKVDDFIISKLYSCGVDDKEVGHQQEREKNRDLLAKKQSDRGGAMKNRRNFIGSSLLALGTLPSPERAQAIIRDETATFGTTAADSAYSPQNLGINVEPSTSSTTSTSASTIPQSQNKKQATDEIVFNIPMSKIQSSPLGIELADVEFRTNRRVYVKSIMPSSLAAQLGVQTNWVLVSVNGQNTERTNAQGVKQIVAQAIKSNSNGDTLQLIFRDNSFQDQLQSLTSNKDAVTQVAPAGDTTQRNQDGSIRVGVETVQVDQKMVVSQLVPPKLCTRGATTDDLLEISYIGKVAETGDIFDGSAISINGKGIPGR